MKQNPKGSHYETLGVHPSAPLEVIEAAWKVLARKYHPDRNPRNKEAADLAARINAAHDVLKDPKKRAAYDNALGVNNGAHQSHPNGMGDDWTNPPRTGPAAYPAAYPSPYGDEIQQEVQRAGERITEKVVDHIFDQLPPEIVEILRRTAMRRRGGV